MKKNYLKALLSKAVLCTVLASGYGYAQNAYTVESIPYQIYDASTPLTAQIDDKYSEVITIPFDFVFFGETHNELLINGNGFIDFRTELAGTPSGWQFNTTIPNVDFPYKDVILGCFHDINSAASGSVGAISWSVFGEAPYRKFTVGFSDMYQFSCNANAISSFQIILHETYNYIDVQIAEKGLCSAWNNGNAVVGIVDSTGLNAYAPPGRNTGQWTVTTGEGWRFKTDGVATIPDNVPDTKLISIYPNPATDCLSVHNNSGKQISGIGICSISGQEVLKASNNETINVSGLQNGIYFVKIKTDNQELNYKFVKK